MGPDGRAIPQAAGNRDTAYLFGGIADSTSTMDVNSTYVFNDFGVMKQGRFVRWNGDSGPERFGIGNRPRFLRLCWWSIFRWSG